jgi:hypothetical protein
MIPQWAMRGIVITPTNFQILACGLVRVGKNRRRSQLLRVTPDLSWGTPLTWSKEESSNSSLICDPSHVTGLPPAYDPCCVFSAQNTQIATISLRKSQSPCSTWQGPMWACYWHLSNFCHCFTFSGCPGHSSGTCQLQGLYTYYSHPSDFCLAPSTSSLHNILSLLPPPTRTGI